MTVNILGCSRSGNTRSGDFTAQEVPCLLTPSQVADRLAVSRSAVYAWAKAGRLRALYLGRLPRFTEADVMDFIASQQQREVSP
jgi:excisionase family DNA binding protein